MTAPRPAGDDVGEFRLTLRPLASDVPATARVRRLLKHLLRALDLRCVSIEPAELGDDPRKELPR